MTSQEHDNEINGKLRGLRERQKRRVRQVGDSVTVLIPTSRKGYWTERHRLAFDGAKGTIIGVSASPRPAVYLVEFKPPVTVPDQAPGWRGTYEEFWFETEELNG